VVVIIILSPPARKQIQSNLAARRQNISPAYEHAGNYLGGKRLEICRRPLHQQLVKMAGLSSRNLHQNRFQRLLLDVYGIEIWSTE
jgi:hypothetical protein